VGAIPSNFAGNDVQPARLNRTRKCVDQEDGPLSPYEQAFNRIRAEYEEMPGMRLTPEQVERLSGVDRAVCRLVLDDLVRAQFLATGHDGLYGRRSDPDRSGRRVRNGDTDSDVIASSSLTGG
jgi:hypothetical protein